MRFGCKEYSIRKRILQACALMLFTVVILLGCEQNMKQDFVMQLPMKSVANFSQITPDWIKSQMQEMHTKNKNRNMPEIEVDSLIIRVKIHNEEEYQAFVDCLEEYVDCSILTMDLEETDTIIYLDEILAYHNFEILNIVYGGTILVRNMGNLKENPLEEIELRYPYAIEENILSQMPALQDIDISLNSRYTGVLPAKELLHNTDCGNIDMIWDDDKKYEVHLEELAEWDEINAALLENSSYLKGIYVWNEENYNYISYEFCREETVQACAAFICIKDRESYGEKYFDILEVPVESIDSMSWSGGSRMRLDDMNFDGYRDLIFMGWDQFSGDFPKECIGFLWNEKEQRYEWNATVPKFYRGIDDERKQIINISPSFLCDKYYIYEYNGSIFTEKKLVVTPSNNKLTWEYYEDGKLLKRLEKTYDENEERYRITYEENGMVTEKVMEEFDYDKKYDTYGDLGKEYFPKFDFYWFG